MTGYEVTVGGVGVCEAYGAVVTGASIGDPETKTYSVDIPGGDGAIDLTEAAAGQPVYSNREIRVAMVVEADREAFSTLITRIRSSMHGRRLPVECSWDPGYSYEGRVSIEVGASLPTAGEFEIVVDANPYKRKPDQTYRVRAGGGATVDLPSGRMRVSPVFECSRATVVTCNGVSETLPVGSHKVRGLYLREGKNRMYLNSTPDLTPATWGDYAGDTWGDHAGMTWAEVAWRGRERPTGDQYDVFITYEWGDL